jgi:hypothetical protein
MNKGKIVENIEKSITEEIQDLEAEKNGLGFMMGFTEDWNIKRDYLTQIFNIEERMEELKRQLNK